MATVHQIIHIQPDAPRKPAVGAPCNGCGVCCLVAPCPLGMVLSGRRVGACDALRWVAPVPGALTGGAYRCGAISQPVDVMKNALPKRLTVLAPALAWILGRLASRWVAVGKGCDSSLQVDVALATDVEPVFTSKAGARMPHD